MTTLLRRRSEMRREPLANCHDGEGALDWTSVFDGGSRQVNFIHDDVIPPGVSIGVHRHDGDEEYYYILEGRGIMTLDDEQYEVGPGDLAVVFPGGSHGIDNRTDGNLRIVVVSVS